MCVYNGTPQQAEARLARLKKDMGLARGKGEEEEMKDYMKQASQGLILTSASMHGPSDGSSSSSRGVGARGARGGMTHSKSDLHLQRQRSLGSSGR